MTKRIIRKEIVLKKLKEIEISLDRIENSIPNNFEAFETDNLIKDATYKRAEFILQNIIDICAVISSDLNLGIPASEEDYISNLEKAKIITKELAVKIKEMKGFRNLLVHKYGELDNEIAFENITNGVDDFNNFIKIVENILKDNENGKTKNKQ